uniref:Methyltransferase type 11 domain-containing protein n=1 Tax=Ananas comosus var. bracteatus TaxID=296719 RepID=A0A6V7PI04_ANACO|nr:unnamed protein product [Ananas comosus var. bracteatus]
MGSVSLKIGDGTARFRRSTLCSSALHLLMLASVLTTNLFALYAFTQSSSHPPPPPLPRVPHPAGDRRVPAAAAPDGARAVGLRLPALVLPRPPLRAPDVPRPAPAPPRPRLPLPPHPHARLRLPPLLPLPPPPLPLHVLLPHSPAPPRPPPPPLPPLQVLRPPPRRRCLSRPRPRPRPAANLSLDRRRWTKPRWKADFPLDDVLALAAGGVRVGFDVAGGAADFAAGMAERNVTVVTSVVDSPGKPLNELVAARGLFPLLLAPAHRFPFYDAVFDLVHLSAALDEGGAPALGRSGRQEALEFLLFDIDRILRVGGLLWIDNYLCADDDRKRAVTRLIERFAYKKLKWVVGEKADPGKKTPRVYLSAVLQKPPRIYLSNVGTTDQTGRICESDALDCQAGSISSKTSKKVTVHALQNYRLVLAKNRFSGGIREELIGGIRER